MTVLGAERSCQFVVGCRKELSPPVFTQLLAYRHAVFIGRLGWSLPARGALELDEFDTESTVYVVCLGGEDGEVYGCGRLLPTTGPYLLQKHFAHLVGGVAPPASRCTWELSRYSAGKPAERRADGQALARLMFERCLQAAARRNATRVVGVLSLAVERIFRRLGVPLRRLGPPQLHEGRSIVGCSVDLPPAFDACLAATPANTGARACSF